MALRAHTMAERNGAPHVGVAPLVTVRQVGSPLGVSTHSIICGVLPRPDLLAAKTAEFRELYESTKGRGSRATYDAGIEYLKGYYVSPDLFDPDSITTLVRMDSPLAVALAADPALPPAVLRLQSWPGRIRGARPTTSTASVAWSSTAAPSCTRAARCTTTCGGTTPSSTARTTAAWSLRFRHLATFDTRFGRLEAVA